MNFNEKLDLILGYLELGKDNYVEREYAIRELSIKKKIKKTHVESIYLVIKELGFIEEDNDRYISNNFGRNFVRYIKFNVEDSHQEKIIANKLCVTLPPKWSHILKDYADSVESTLHGERLVADSENNDLCIITPYIDAFVLQSTLKDFHHKDKELTIITSDPKLGSIDESNYLYKRYVDIIKRRFKKAKVFFFEEHSAIAHAKIWVSKNSVFITSANIKPESATDNLEIGVYSEDQNLVKVVNSFVNRILAEKDLKCIMTIEN
jgi:phosphatidylserine/phosphatidylglycerophosphate/cardiolipin synthase-like enzyme